MNVPAVSTPAILPVPEPDPTPGPPVDPAPFEQPVKLLRDAMDVARGAAVTFRRPSTPDLLDGASTALRAAALLRELPAGDSRRAGTAARDIERGARQLLDAARWTRLPAWTPDAVVINRVRANGLAALGDFGTALDRLLATDAAPLG